MPIICQHPLRRLNQDQFGAIAYEIVGCAFEIHTAMGRFFDEHVYRNEIFLRFEDRAVREFEVRLAHGDYQKILRIDLLIDGTAVFEFKSVSKLGEQQRGQLIQYLMLTDLPHGKLLNFRPDQLEHEFINCSVRTAERHRYCESRLESFADSASGRAFETHVFDLFADWGTGLDVHLYEEAIACQYGGLVAVEKEINVRRNGHRIGSHRVRLIDPTTAYKITAIREETKKYESHLTRLLMHTDLERILWVNATLDQVTLREIRNQA